MTAAKVFYDLEETADILRVSTYTIRNYIKEGRIPANRVGRKYLIPAEYISRIRAAALVERPCKKVQAEATA